MGLAGQINLNFIFHYSIMLLHLFDLIAFTCEESGFVDVLRFGPECVVSLVLLLKLLPPLKHPNHRLGPFIEDLIIDEAICFDFGNGAFLIRYEVIFLVMLLKHHFFHFSSQFDFIYLFFIHDGFMRAHFDQISII